VPGAVPMLFTLASVDFSSVAGLGTAAW